jgi:crotonobetainyl-CoA:carnitine CoA-transferase CaiB-like acyl-CoA transferase
LRRLLAGYRVVESSMLLNGATTGMHLVDLGADVIKIESPFRGDYLRMDVTRHLHQQSNRGKRSLAVDLRADQGRDILRRLLAGADVFVTNARSGSNERMGLSYEQVRAIRPDIVYCQNTGFGATGPYADLPVHGQMMDALAGAMPADMGDDGLTRPAAPARRTGTMSSGGEGTAAGALQAALHIAAGLAGRARSGEGCYIDVSSSDAVVASAWVAASGQLNEVAEEPYWVDPERTRAVARYQYYETRDGVMLMFCPEEDKFWQAFCVAVGRPEWGDRQNGVSLRRDLQELFHTRDRQDWMELAVEHGVPMGPAYGDMEQIRHDPQIRTRQILHDRRDATGSIFHHIGSPAVVAGQPFEVLATAPELGEHTAEVLAELGYTAEEIADLAAAQVTTAAYRKDPIPGNLYGQDSIER